MCDRCEMDFQRRTLLCACGYSEDSEPNLNPRFRGMTTEEIQERGALLSEKDRELYEFYFELAKPHETKPREAAQFALYRVEGYCATLAKRCRVTVTSVADPL